jgi:hypothetical protein
MATAEPAEAVENAPTALALLAVAAAELPSAKLLRNVADAPDPMLVVRRARHRIRTQSSGIFCGRMRAEGIAIAAVAAQGDRGDVGGVGGLTDGDSLGPESIGVIANRDSLQPGRIAVVTDRDGPLSVKPGETNK